MSKRHSAAELESQPPSSPQQARLAPWAKALISLCLALHLTAVFVAPFAFACNAGGSSSPLADAVYRKLRPYIAAVFLDHGYFFFAPNPGPTHLVDYKVEFADGKPPIEGRFPNLATERPRLLYHRYFMLSEALHASFVPADGPPEPSPPPLTASSEERTRFQLERAQHQAALADWQRRRKQYEALRESIERHLLEQYGAKRVTLTRIEHRPPLPDEFDSLGRRLNDAASYVKLSETAVGAGR
jgi:hypothetical protein